MLKYIFLRNKPTTIIVLLTSLKYEVFKHSLGRRGKIKYANTSLDKNIVFHETKIKVSNVRLLPQVLRLLPIIITTSVVVLSSIKRF